MKNIIMECQHLKKTYKKRNKKLIVLKDINYKFVKGRVYAIVGKSGAGKTTLINLLGVLKKPDSGKIIILDEDISKIKDNKRTMKLIFICLYSYCIEKIDFWFKIQYFYRFLIYNKVRHP